jgi:protein O-mannosyl-transferase
MIEQKSKLIVVLILIIATIAIYWPVQNYEFIKFDEEQYVTKNLHVQAGLSLENVKWAFTTTEAHFWHPLTWLSLMLDYQLFKLNAGGYHWTNLLLHLISTILLFLVFNKMTGSVWRSGFVAALFALHPLHVESVAWIAERKDVLSGVFWMLIMYAYLAYVNQSSLWRYSLMLLVFVLGLMAKPMLVTLPFVLLLLDYWPLHRFTFELKEAGENKRRKLNVVPIGKGNTISHLILEKIPLIVLSILFSIIAFIVQRSASAVSSLDSLSILARVSNASVSYVEYISKMLVPVNLAIFYPHPGTWPLWQVFLCLVVFINFTFIVIFCIKKYPYLAFGWFWYAGTLIPVIGLVQVGSQAMADRYTYIPCIGLFVAIAWGLFDLTKKRRKGKAIFRIISVLIIAIMMVITSIQVGYWKNSISLYSHAIEVTNNNYLANNNLGAYLINIGDYKQAYFYITKAIQIKPNYVDAHRNLVKIFVQEGKREKAINHLKEAIKINSDYTDAIIRLADVLAEDKRFEEAVDQYKELLTYDPVDYEALNNLGVVLAQTGKTDDAITLLRKALYLKADYIDAKRNLGILLKQKESKNIN